MVRVVAQVTPNERNSRRQTGWEVAATPARLQPGGTRSHNYDLAVESRSLRMHEQAQQQRAGQTEVSAASAQRLAAVFCSDKVQRPPEKVPLFHSNSQIKSSVIFTF